MLCVKKKVKLEVKGLIYCNVMVITYSGVALSLMLLY